MMVPLIRKIILLLVAFLFAMVPCFCKSGLGDSVNTKRATILSIGLPVAHATSIILFNELWYRNQPREGFHFFDDGNEWKQVDKIGHLHSAFYFTSAGARMFNWSGVENRKSDLLGSATSMIFMTTIEILDGFSSDFGASGWDLLSNTVGIGFYLGQKAIWNEVRIHPKFSFSPTNFPNIRPEVLGSNSMEEFFKDYNGQTYWLSFDIDKFIPGSKPGILKWINVAAGYGAHNMIYAKDSENIALGYEPYRQYYLALDFDLSHIRSKSGFVNSLLYFVNMIHLPAPGLEFTKNKVKFRYITF